jgi:hypothetical protein
MRGSVRVVRARAGASGDRPVRRIGQLAEAIVLALGLVALIAASIALRGTTHRSALTVGAGATSLTSLQASAADQLATALAKGGSGISFEVV